MKNDMPPPDPRGTPGLKRDTEQWANMQNALYDWQNARAFAPGITLSQAIERLQGIKERNGDVNLVSLEERVVGIAFDGREAVVL
tara:strand:- start:803 stop:1057 length:255 start_codon:yes stop_codon:yes gene_type:complete